MSASAEVLSMVLRTRLDGGGTALASFEALGNLFLDGRGVLNVEGEAIPVVGGLK
jgi:hypothetical protein